jgi:hypothetical protein
MVAYRVGRLVGCEPYVLLLTDMVPTFTNFLHMSRKLWDEAIKLSLLHMQQDLSSGLRNLRVI